MQRTIALLAVTAITLFTAVAPAQAEGSAKSFEHKKAQRLEKANKKLAKAQSKVDCIEKAKDMATLKSCK